MISTRKASQNQPGVPKMGDVKKASRASMSPPLCLPELKENSLSDSDITVRRLTARGARRHAVQRLTPSRQAAKPPGEEYFLASVNPDFDAAITDAAVVLIIGRHRQLTAQAGDFTKQHALLGKLASYRHGPQF